MPDGNKNVQVKNKTIQYGVKALRLLDHILVMGMLNLKAMIQKYLLIK